MTKTLAVLFHRLDIALSQSSAFKSSLLVCASIPHHL